MSLLHRNIYQDVADGLDFMLAILPNEEYPRNILVGPYHSPFEVWNRDDILYRYKATLYEDCYLNAYPNYQWMIENGRLSSTFLPPPNHLMMDIDRENFVDEQAFNQTIADIKANIGKYLTGATGAHPIIIDSGNGYHVHVPMPGIVKSFEEVPEFQQFKNPAKASELDIKFLRYLERKLTNSRSDQRHRPSVNSLMFRIPGTINTRAKIRGKKDPHVKVVEGRDTLSSLEDRVSRPTDKLLNDFYLYLMQKKTESRVEEFERESKRLWQSLEPRRFDNNTGIIPWIEKILITGVEDQRKDLLFWVLVPYLITIKRLDHEQAFDILDGWLAKCSEVRRLEPRLSEFHHRINYTLRRCADRLESQEPWWPIKLETFQEYYPDLYEELFGSGAQDHKS